MKRKDSNVVADQLMKEALDAVEKRETEGVDSQDVEVSVAVDESSSEAPQTQAVDLSNYVEKENFLRLFAEFENFRKRAQKEREAAEISGREKILKGFLEVLDSFDRGFANLKDDTSPIAEGVRMILSQSEHWLRTEGLERIATVGEVFDPAQHEAVASLESESIESGKIIQELRRGYKWQKRLLRAASVVVSKGAPAVTAMDKTDPVLQE